MKTFFTVLAGSIAFFLTIAMVGLTDWDRPPLAVQQSGFRGTAMDQIHTRAGAAETKAANVAPAPADPAEPGEELAGATYENVQVLKNVSVNEFNRLMVSMTEWVSPEQGCTYCHNTENMADDSLYQKKVARRMLQMTQHINESWKDNHVGGTGVTCFTCHRGQPVPAHVWFTDPGPNRPGGFIARNNGQNLAKASVGLASLPYDTLTEYLADKTIDNNAIRVNATTALPTTKGKPIQDAEKTYGLMIHMSEGLGVNCTFCHNTRAISNWSQSTPQRTTAWHGIRMVRDINGNYLEPLTSTFPTARLGMLGDVPKVNCTTCHNGQSKPLNGAQVIGPYPELAKSTETASAADPAPADPAPTPAPQ
ncbi:MULTISPECIES: photosynthetic reaction center cytochrome PufC [unclassified Methylobacterium]|uniref:photosynthetic reaction center cytochrome PufC n=1 Tax=unclassified Methylobacterium TaxID=2615210 RepID=UPI0006FE6708|nr:MULTISPECIES: photosynthetic reaction center cytochrome PufC [unclassified Methylobacterium]KQO58210.1 Photosynthetic reaction center cytochrome C subunit [Methylobacterium sp. Leaf86]KQO97271.1 Photosynthetic reaction center cytochrome C subunit [Methylobacterium sp. Leaf91]